MFEFLLNSQSLPLKEAKIQESSKCDSQELWIELKITAKCTKNKFFLPKYKEQNWKLLKGLLL